MNNNLKLLSVFIIAAIALAGLTVAVIPSAVSNNVAFADNDKKDSPSDDDNGGGNDPPNNRNHRGNN